MTNTKNKTPHLKQKAAPLSKAYRRSLYREPPRLFVSLKVCSPLWTSSLTKRGRMLKTLHGLTAEGTCQAGDVGVKCVHIDSQP